MLRRDTEYVLTWDALEHCWLARPLPDGIQPLASLGRPVDVVAVGDHTHEIGGYEL